MAPTATSGDLKRKEVHLHLRKSDDHPLMAADAADAVTGIGLVILVFNAAAIHPNVIFFKKSCRCR